MIARNRIQPVSVAKQSDDLLEPPLDLVICELGAMHEPFCVGDLGANLGLSLLQDFDGEGIRHIRVDELVALPFQVGQPSTLFS